MGQADGVACRTVEMFNAFGLSDRLLREAYWVNETVFWRPDAHDRDAISRTGRVQDTETGLSEFPHVIVNQARVQDYFAESMALSPSRMTPDYGWEFVGLRVGESGDYPVAVTLRRTIEPDVGAERVVHARYVVGCDGAHSAVRESIGRTMEGDQALHAWGVMDVLAVTDFPDIRTKCAIQSHDGGNILLIPREGGYLFRMYVDLGEVPPDDNGAVRQTTIDQIIAQANRILSPYSLDVKNVAWHSVYEVAHRLTDRFDDVPNGRPADGTHVPRVFIAGDACHTHSAKAGQGMNVSMQDGFNIAWKLGHVLDGRAPESLLSTYSAERQVIAKNLIDFDKRWSALMAAKQDELEDPAELEQFYVKTFEFPAGFMTQYEPSLVIAPDTHQDLAAGFPIGKRFKSAPVVRVCDGNPLQLGHHARADGRWRIYVFADAAGSAVTDLAGWLTAAAGSPLAATPAGLDRDAWFDVKVVYQQPHGEIDLGRVPEVFLPRTGPFGLIDYEKVYAADPASDIFELRGVDRAGAIVVVRPDQYVAAVLPLTPASAATDGLAGFFAPILFRS